ncbi:MAG: hypothetical protein QM644_11040 [Mobilitalea sp.]
MDVKYNPNAVNQFLKGTNVFTEGESVFHVAMIIKGRVLIHNNGLRVVMGSGSFLGINDLYLGKYQSTYTAVDDLLLYLYPVKHIDEIETILSLNKDYHGYMVASYYKEIYDLDQIYQGIIKHGSELNQFLENSFETYQALALRSGNSPRQPEWVKHLSFLDRDMELFRDRIDYYSECRNLPIDAVKVFYSYGNAITLYQLEDQVGVINQQIEELKEISKEYYKLASLLMADNDSCLFHLIAELSIKTGSSINFNNELIDLMDLLIEEINKAELFTERMLGKKLAINRQKMEEVYHLLLVGDKLSEEVTELDLKYSREDSQRAINELEESFETILKYAEISEERANQMHNVMQDFIHLKDKFSSEDAARAIRRRVSDNHYEIYKKVFPKAYHDGKTPRLIEMFLKYGYCDERLLTKEQLLSLYYLKEQPQNQESSKIYDIKEWLTLIYEGKRDPSKNEFDQEYAEMLNSLKKHGTITELEAKDWLHNPEKRVEYEIDNMFRYNNRTTNGQISSFVPVLHKDLWANNIERLRVTTAKVNDAIAEILKIDYSVFDREVIYSDKEKNIVKEYIIKRVFPDIILMPNVGSNGVMWQEITGKRRDSAGRFLLPIFTDMNLVTLLTRIFGRYRWELCRTIEGAAWNDISHKSLTSEYSDYIQFYRKNKELSEERKERVKQQIQKGRNNNREIFVIDYEQWIQNESLGAMKLNKPVREIMATYCPFSLEIREKIKLHPVFADAMTRYNKEKLKKIREVESRFRLLQKDQVELTPELLYTLNYYKEV